MTVTMNITLKRAAQNGSIDNGVLLARNQ
jgi:hypothetical protein